jgi:hypothetical protein
MMVGALAAAPHDMGHTQQSFVGIVKHVCPGVHLLACLASGATSRSSSPAHQASSAAEYSGELKLVVHVPSWSPFHPSTASAYGLASFPRKRESRRRSHGDRMPACAGMTFDWRRTCETDIWRVSLRSDLTGFVQTIDVYTGFEAPTIRASERHDRGAIDAI